MINHLWRQHQDRQRERAVRCREAALEGLRSQQVEPGAAVQVGGARARGAEGHEAPGEQSGAHGSDRLGARPQTQELCGRELGVSEQVARGAQSRRGGRDWGGQQFGQRLQQW
jgi:hypothetical protein